MKQCLTVDQLSILDFKQQKEIATLFGQFGNCSRNDNEGNEYLILGLLAERITIGKMIEALHSLNYSWTYELSEEVFINKGENYCDALWEEVKTTLNK